MIRFTLNGTQIEIEDGESCTLLEYLRNVKCMKGTKEACSTGHCGACSVLVDGRLTRSCVTLVRRLDGKAVETIENASNDTMLQVIQHSFLDVGAVQCGFCTPGMVMATKALLLHHPAPTEPEICDGLKNNYCRCTGYVKIIEAVKLAAARLRGEDPDIDSFRSHESTVIVVGENQVVPEITGSAVGKSVWDVDGMDKTGGKLKFCDDLTAEDIGADTLLHGAFVWAPAPHAKINAVDYSAAEQAEGVVRIVTAADVPGMNKVGTWTPEQPVFCTDEVRFLGDHLALVVADTAAHARAAVKLVKIDYEELPGIYTMADGYRKNSFIVHTGRVSGDVEQAKQRTDIVKLNVSKDIEPQEHACMEPVSAIGMVQDSKTILYSCTQAPFEIRSMLAKILDKPEEDIRVIVTPLGGGFGKKCDSFLEAPAVVAAHACGKPVKITLTRKEDLILTTKRHGYHTDYEIGFTPDGKFQYLDCRMFSDGGPYECESYGTLMTGALMSGGPYIIPNVKVEGSAIRNNNLQGGAFRGYGINQAAISIETAMDMMAEKLDIDPFELRRRNAVYPGATSVGGEVLKYSMGMIDTINQCEKSLRKALKEYEGQYPKGSKVLGWGMASGFKNVGVGKGIFTDDGACRLILQGDGQLHMIVSGTDMGQGFRTAMTQIAAETLGMDIADIYITNGDTELTIPTGESVSERQTLCGGRAVYEACVKLKQDLDSRPWRLGEERRAEYYYASNPCFAIGDFEGAKQRGAKYRNFPAYAYATQAAIVEVDTETGEVRLLKIIAAHDVGRAINPHIIEGQMHGSCSMGQGYALTEGYPTKNGYPVKTLYRQLGLPRAEDTPDYEIILIENPEPQGPFGAKGISEVATVPITPAILNAVSRAIGVRINKVPASPEVVREAIRTGKCEVPTMEQQLQALEKDCECHRPSDGVQ